MGGSTGGDGGWAAGECRTCSLSPLASTSAPSACGRRVAAAAPSAIERPLSISPTLRSFATHRIASHPTPFCFILSRHVASHLIPPSPSHPIPSHPIPLIPFHSTPFHSTPFHSIPLHSTHSTPFHSIPFHPIPFYSIPFHPILEYPHPTYPALLELLSFTLSPCAPHFQHGNE